MYDFAVLQLTEMRMQKMEFFFFKSWAWCQPQSLMIWSHNLNFFTSHFSSTPMKNKYLFQIVANLVKYFAVNDNLYFIYFHWWPQVTRKIKNSNFPHILCYLYTLHIFATILNFCFTKFLCKKAIDIKEKYKFP